MKLIEAEYTFDNNKVLFYFTADGRIDFRELVKDLAAVFKTRIELRQIGGTLISTLHSSYGYLNMLTGRRGNIDVDYWTPENTDAKYPKPGGVMSSDNPKYGSSLGYIDAGYLKIRTITLGYNFDRIKAVRDFGISKLP